MKQLLLIIFFTTTIFAYTKYTDSKNVYFESEHFRVISNKIYENNSFVTNYVTQSLEAAEHSWDRLITNLNFKEPNHQNQVIDIYLTSVLYDSNYDYGGFYTDNNNKVTISSNYAGVASYYISDQRPYFILNPLLDDNQIKVTISHEFLHTIHYSYVNFNDVSNEIWNSSIWWLEATATLSEDEVYDEINDYLSFLEFFFNDSTKNFETYNGDHEYSMVIFAKYLREKFGIEIIRKTFEYFANNQNQKFYDVIDSLLSSEHSSSMEKELVEFAKWVSNAPKYFEEGSLYPVLKHFNIEDNITLEKGGIVVYDNIKSNWNLVTLPNSDINSLEINGSSAIWTWEGNNWKNNISNDIYVDINSTNINQAYWIFSEQNSSSYFTYYDTSSELSYDNLNNQWNFVGTSKEISLDQLQNVQVVWSFINDKWYGYSNNNSFMNQILESGYEQLRSIKPYSGFWIYK